MAEYEKESIFDGIFTYTTNRGILVPSTSEIRDRVEQGFKYVFGQEMDTTTETPAGRFIEAFTMMLVNVIGVNAINANGLNVRQAIGNWLDMDGAVFDVDRLRNVDGTVQSDEAYREAILASNAHGVGFAESVSREIRGVDGVSGVCVLNNGDADPAVIGGIRVDPHSVFICVEGGADDEVAKAINRSISAGCGFSYDESYGTETNVAIPIEGTSTVANIRFYRPSRMYYKVSAVVRAKYYPGDDPEYDASFAIADYLHDHRMNSSVGLEEIQAEISRRCPGLVCTTVELKTSDDGVQWDDVSDSSLWIPPYKSINVPRVDGTYQLEAPDSITVTFE